MTKMQELLMRISQNRLAKYRRILNSIHALGNIYYDIGRMQAYSTIAKLASEEREERRRVP